MGGGARAVADGLPAPKGATAGPRGSAGASVFCARTGAAALGPVGGAGALKALFGTKTWASGRSFIGLKAGAAALRDFLCVSTPTGRGSARKIDAKAFMLLSLPFALATRDMPSAALAPSVVLIRRTEHNAR